MQGGSGDAGFRCGATWRNVGPELGSGRAVPEFAWEKSPAGWVYLGYLVEMLSIMHCLLLARGW